MAERVNGFVRTIRHVYNPLGFSKGYNFVLFFLAIGYLFAFTLARLEYLAFNTVFCGTQRAPGVGAAPGECFYWLQDPFKLGMKLHLYTILPASLLVTLQWVPVIRHKVRLFHRLNGYTIVSLSLISNAGTIIIAKHTFGGDFATQALVGMLVVLTTIGYIMAWVNIKLLQIDQHRAWMMRTWAWVNSALGRGGTLAFYPACASYFDGSSPDKRVIVTPGFGSDNPMEISAALAMPFGTAGWIALVLHTIAVEIYLRLTPVESDRLRQVSYERQLERGFRRPGYAGLTVERFGDGAPYRPSQPDHGQSPAVDEEAGPGK
ncbi:hypothetical protein LTR53_000907 [Teratosphaeriaceae sp. CCFEE 6253]|nr:hypothetical protein LTR53_000907 [Teratosphaeriaceae sp. CCFEE 6253]